jgi:REP element-mobilizing transposase RayT
LAGAAVAVIAYCLMPNHYHFLLRSERDDAIGRFVQRLFNSYTQAFNRQQTRSGTLFEGRAKSILIDNEGYLIYLCRYIHLNPVVAGLVAKAEDWPYSNYLEWIGARPGTLVDRDFMCSYFANAEEYRTFIEETIEESVARSLTKYCGE